MESIEDKAFLEVFERVAVAVEDLRSILRDLVEEVKYLTSEVKEITLRKL